jgi:HAD superfamily hydrolase (TIGR01549 family)
MTELVVLEADGREADRAGDGASGSSRRLVLFDLDGVLVDSRAVMDTAWEAVRRRVGVTVPFASYFREIGRPFHEIIDRLGLASRLAEIEQVYRSVSMEHCREARAFPGVDDALRRLDADGALLGVVTSKSRTLTAETLAQFSVDFATVKTPDDGPGKPEPDLLFSAMAETGAAVEDTVFVGDMSVDGKAAANAGVAFLHAGWGYGGRPAGSGQLRSPGEIAGLGWPVVAASGAPLVRLGPRSAIVTALHRVVRPPVVARPDAAAM